MHHYTGVKLDVCEEFPTWLQLGKNAKNRCLYSGRELREFAAKLMSNVAEEAGPRILAFINAVPEAHYSFATRDCRPHPCFGVFWFAYRVKHI